jgi:hypothetical protein
VPPFRHPLFFLLAGLLAVTAVLSERGTAAAPAGDATFQLAKALKKPDVMYVLTRDAEARQLGLSDADWKMFMTGRLAADPPRRTAEEEPLFHQAFDPSTTVSDELLPGFAALNAISEVDQIPRGQLVEVLVREPEKYQSEMKLAAESVEAIMGGGIFKGLYGILKERALDRFKEDLAQHSLNTIYGAYRDARLTQRLSSEEAFSSVQEMGTGLSDQGSPRFKLEWQWAWGSFHDLLEKFGLPSDAASVNRAMQHYFDKRFQRSAFQSVTMEDAVEDMVREPLAEAKTRVVKELNYRVRQRLQGWHEQIRDWGNRAAELSNYPTCKYDEAAELAEKVKRASPDHPWLKANERLIRDSQKDAALSQQRLRDARLAASRDDFQQARALLEEVKQDGTMCDLVLAEKELDKMKDAERAASDRRPSLRSSPSAEPGTTEEDAKAEAKKRAKERVMQKATDSVVTGTSAPPPPTQQESDALKPGDSPACRQIRTNGCLALFPGMENFAYFMVVQMGPADAGGCVQVAFYPGMTPDQARQTADAALRYSTRSPVPMKAVYGPASYQSAVDYARRLCREKSGTDKTIQQQMR